MDTNLKRTIGGVLALAIFGVIALIAIHFLPSIPLPSKQTSRTLDSVVLGGNGSQNGANPFGSDRAGGGNKSEPGGVALAGPITLDYTKVLEVHSPSPNYWRMKSYDTFNGFSWENNVENPTEVQCNESFYKSTPESSPSDISIHVLGSGQSALIGPLSPTKICVQNSSIKTTFDAHSLSLTTSEPLPVNSVYTVESSVGAFSPAELKTAPQNFPADIQSYYLQLPTNTPDRIKQLALKITKEANTEYDKASAIEKYLSSIGEYRYTLEPPRTPSGRNGVDYFLFDIKRGYCAYFSSAMTILLRSIGIPAREVSGFAPGPWSELTHSVVLDNHLAHAWTEVYFPNYGWVSFEPTAGGPGQPEVIHSSPPPEKITTKTEITKFPSSFYRKDLSIVTGDVRVLNGGGVPGAAVTIYLTKDKKSQGVEIGTGKTDINGIFNVAISVSSDFQVGNFMLVARYRGDDKYFPSDSDPEVTIRAHTSLVVSATTSTDGIKVSGSLKDDAGNPIANVGISLTVNSVAAVDTQTDTAGSFNYSLTAQPGTYNITASFAGTEIYDGAEKTITVLISFPKSLPQQSQKIPPKPVKTPVTLPQVTAIPVNASTSPPGAQKTAPWWIFVLVAFLGIGVAGGCYWYYRKHSVTLKDSITPIKNILWHSRVARKKMEIDRNFLKSKVLQREKIFLDIQFPQIESDLPLFWGTIDSPLDVVKIVRPNRPVHLTINGKEREILAEKGKYIFRLQFGDQYIEKTVCIINYSEEIGKDFKALNQKYSFEMAKFTAREVIEQVKSKEPNQRRLDMLLALFEKHVYGKKEIIRNEYVDYYRSA